MKRRYIALLAGAGLLASGGVFGHYLTRPTISVSAVRIKVHPLPPAAAPASVEPDSIHAHVATAAPSASPVAAAAPRRPAVGPEPAAHARLDPARVPVLNARDWLDHLDGPLTDQQRADLDRVFKTVASMQSRIDQHDDPAERAELQDKLIYQLVVRLRAVLGDARIHDQALALSENKPRIRYE
jgi:hypothetical protein